MTEIRSSTVGAKSTRSLVRRALCWVVCLTAATLASLWSAPGVAQGTAEAAQAAAPGPRAASANQAIVGTWQGTLHAGRDLRIVVKVTTDEKGACKVDMYSIDQNPRPIPADTASFQDKEFKFAIKMIEGSYDGKMSSDSNTIEGTWTQGASHCR